VDGKGRVERGQRLKPRRGERGVEIERILLDWSKEKLIEEGNETESIDGKRGCSALYKAV